MIWLHGSTVCFRTVKRSSQDVPTVKITERTKMHSYFCYREDTGDSTWTEPSSTEHEASHLHGELRFSARFKWQTGRLTVRHSLVCTGNLHCIQQAPEQRECEPHWSKRIFFGHSPSSPRGFAGTAGTACADSTNPQWKTIVTFSTTDFPLISTLFKGQLHFQNRELLCLKNLSNHFM